jgi:hypothetical protein
MGFVIIPSDYEQLPEARRRTTVPIYIQSTDRYGNAIDGAWFDRGVAPIYQELIELAGTTLGDRRMVSDIAEPSVHKLWYRHGSDVGEKPHGRVWRQALWEARDLAAGGWRERKGRVVSRTLEEIDRAIPAETLDENDSAALYDRRILIESMRKTMQRQGATEMLRIHELILAGCSWSEVGCCLGLSTEAVKRRFYRHAKRTFAATA